MVQKYYQKHKEKLPKEARERCQKSFRRKKAKKDLRQITKSF